MSFFQDSYKLMAIFLQTSFELLASLCKVLTSFLKFLLVILWTSYELLMNFLWTSYELLMSLSWSSHKFIWILYKVFSIIQASHKFFVNKLFMNILQASSELFTTSKKIITAKLLKSPYIFLLTSYELLRKQ